MTLRAKERILETRADHLAFAKLRANTRRRHLENLGATLD